MSTVQVRSIGEVSPLPRSRWLLPAAVALAILAATSWPSPPALPNQSDKLVHFSSYALLGGSVAWAAGWRRLRRVMAWVCLLTLLGALDEWHQQFIPGRRMDVRDWVADTAGAVTGLFLVTALARRRESVA